MTVQRNPAAAKRSNVPSVTIKDSIDMAKRSIEIRRAEMRQLQQFGSDPHEIAAIKEVIGWHDQELAKLESLLKARHKERTVEAVAESTS
jgi:hypothetical protein